MILIATSALTVLHPGRCFHGHWKIPAGSKDRQPGYDSDDTGVTTPPKTPVAVVKECSRASAEGENIQSRHDVMRMTGVVEPKSSL